MNNEPAIQIPPWPHYEQDEIDAVQRVLAAGKGNYWAGEAGKLFEQEFADYCGTRCAVGVSNGLDALFLIIKAYGIGVGDEVIVPSNTYIASWLAVTRTGAQIRPVEPSEDTFNIDPSDVEHKILELKLLIDSANKLSEIK